MAVEISIAKIMKSLIEEKEFFIYPYKKVEEIYDIVYHKQIWFNDYYIQFLEGDNFLNSSVEYQKSVLYNLYSEIKLKSKFKKLFFLPLIVVKDAPSKDTLEKLNNLFLWLKQDKIHANIILVDLSSQNSISLYSDFEDKEYIVNYLNNLLPILGTDFEEINLFEIERKTKIEKGYYFSEKKGLLTKLLIAINILFFLYISYKGSTTDIYSLIKYGAKYNPLIADGEYYRLISNMFIHIGIVHLLLNTYALNILGKDIEAIYGPYKFLLIYLISGVFGSLGSFLFSKAVSAGASGAIFGLIGAYLYFGIRKPAIFTARNGMNLITLLILNIIFGLSNSNIDNFAHFGGLLGGILVSWAFGLSKEKTYAFKRLLKQALLIILVLNLLLIGVHKNQDTWEYHLHKGVTYLQQEDLEKAKYHFNLGLDRNQDISEFYFYIAYIYYFEGNKNAAIEYLNKTLQLNPQDHIAKNFLDEITNR